MTKTSRIRYDLVPILLICGLAFALSYNVISCGTLYGDDSDVHTLWAQQFIKSIKSGNMYPRWVPDVNCGYGSPAFSFYPPVVFYVSAALSLIFREIPSVLVASAVIGLLLSGLFMYAYSSLIFARRVALLVSIAYMAIPYHVADLYLRSALAEFWAFVWVPLLFYFSHKMAETENPLSPVGLSLSYAALVLTHLPSALMFSPFVLVYFFLLARTQRDILIVVKGIAFMILGAGLGSFFLLPFIVEQGYMKIASGAFAWYFDYSNNFLFSSTAGNLPLNHFLSMSSCTYIPVFVAVLFLTRKELDRANVIAQLSALVGIAAFFMMTGFSTPFWNSISYLRQMQFPWRWLFLSSFSLAICLGFLVAQKFRGKLLMVIVLSLLMGYNCFLFFQYKDHYLSMRGADFDNPARRTVSIRPEMSYEELRFNFYRFLDLIYPGHLNACLMDYSMNLPQWVEGELMIAPTEELAYWVNNLGGIRILSWRPEERSLDVGTVNDAMLVLKTFYYPHWKVYVDGVQVKTYSKSSAALLAFRVPPGFHNVKVRFEEGIWFRIGAVISCLTLALLGGFYVLHKRKRRFDGVKGVSYSPGRKEISR